MFVALLLWMFLGIHSVIGASDKHAMKNECTYNNLESGTYRCILPDEKLSFFVDCMIDGTMYINPSQQALYHYYKQAGLEMNFKLLLSAHYDTIKDVDDEQIASLSLKAEIKSNQDDIYDWNNPLSPKKSQSQSQSQGIDDSNLDDDSLEQEELTKAEKSSVNKTAQYIVYGVIIVMALIFSIGICLLIYWWCCHEKILNKRRMNENIITNINDDRSGRLLIDDQDNDDNDDETQPFIDIRGSKTIHRQYIQKSQGRTIYFGIGLDRNHQNMESSLNNDDDDIDIIQRERHNIYDDINGADDDEDGDDLIAHYGSTSNSRNINGGYVIAKFPDNE